MGNLTVITYGGAESLQMLFNATVMLFGDGGIIRPLGFIIAVIGGFWAIAKAFLSPQIDAFIIHYIFPLIIIPSFLMVPKTTVKIEDALQIGVSYSVDNVPLFLARVAEITSTIGYKITVAMESVMHLPNDMSYSKTGMIFGAESSLDISKYKITDGTLEQNFNKFAKQCIAYDLALGRYSLDDLKKTKDLLNFLKTNTSKVRMIRYFDPALGTSNQSDSKQGSYITCKQAAELFSKKLGNEKAYFEKHHILKHLPMTFQYLTGLSKENQDLICQQIMISAVSNGIASANLAKMRAETQQKNTYQTMGSIAGKNLIAMRGVLEALIYGSFILMVPLMLLPLGIKYLFAWIKLTVWIQLWPPFYVILNYLMHINAKMQATSMGITDLTMFTSQGLYELHENIAATAGYLSLSVPFIAYALLEGSQAFVHLAGSLASPAQAAATGAAAELSSGSYSFGNTSVGQMSYQNTSAHQLSTAPSLSEGFMRENKGDHALTHTFGSGKTAIEQNGSRLLTQMSDEKAITQALQNNLNKSQSHNETAQLNYSDTVGKSARAVQDFSSHIGQSTSSSQGFSEQESYGVNESCGYINNAATSFASSHGISINQASDLLYRAGASVSAGLPNIIGIGSEISAGHNQSVSDGVSSSDVINQAMSIADSEDFQKHWNNVTNFAKNSNFSSLNDEGQRLATNLSNSLDTQTSAQQSLQSSYSELNQASQNLSWGENHTSQIRQSLDHPFFKYACDRLGQHEAVRMINDEDTSRQHMMMESFLQERITPLREASLGSLQQDFTTPENSYSNSSIPTMDYESERQSFDRDPSSIADQYGINTSTTGNINDHTSMKFTMANAEHLKEIEHNRQHIDASKRDVRNASMHSQARSQNHSTVSTAVNTIRQSSKPGSKKESYNAPLHMRGE